MTQLSLAGVFCALTLLGPQVSGQDREPIWMGYVHQFAGDLDQGGDVSVDRWHASFAVPLSKGGNHFVALAGSYSVNSFDFAPAFDPWGRVSRAYLGLPVRWKINDKWALTSILRVGTDSESGAETSDSYGYGVLTSVDYRVNDQLVIGPGFGYFSQLEDDAKIYPILSIRWDFADRWFLSTGPSEGANSGANIYVRHGFSDKWDFLAGVFYESQRFRLARNSTFAPNGVGEESFIAAYGVAKYRATEHFSVSVLAGYAFAKDLGVYTQDGATIDEQDVDGSPFIGARFNYRF